MERQTAQIDHGLDTFRELVARARRGDTEARSELRGKLAADAEIWRKSGDLVEQAKMAWIKQITGDNEPFAEALIRQVDAMRDELAGTAATPLEKLLVQRIIIAWLQLGHADCKAAELLGSPSRTTTSVERRLDAAHKRYLAALKALTDLRRRLAGRKRNQV